MGAKPRRERGPEKPPRGKHSVSAPRIRNGPGTRLCSRGAHSLAWKACPIVVRAQHMSGLPYYKAYPRDFIEGTVGMTFELKGAYRLVLDLIYMQDGQLPDDARYISGLLGCSVRKWTSMRDELVKIGKLQIIGEFLTNYRAIIELETLAKLRDKKRENRSGHKKNNELQKRPSKDPDPDPDPDPEPDKSKRTDSDDARGQIPGNLTEREELLVAMGHDPSGVTANGRLVGTRADMAERDRWRDGLGLSHSDQLEIIREVVGRMSGDPPQKFKYFTRAMVEDAGRRSLPALAPAAPRQPNGHDQRPAGGTAIGKPYRTSFPTILAAAARGSTDESWRKG